MSDVFELEVEIDAPRDRVWRALTDPRELEVWFCEHADVSLDDQRYECWGRYTPDVPDRGVQRLVKIEPGRSLVYTWTFRGADTNVEITLDGDTCVHVLHTDVPERTEGGGHLSSHFWQIVLADLKGFLEIGKTAPRFDYSWPHHGGFEADAVIDAPREAVWKEFERRHEASGMPLEDGSAARHPAEADMKLFDVRRLDGWKMEWNDESPDVGGVATVMTYTLSDAGGGTRITIVHSGFAPDADIQGMATGFFSGVRQVAWTLYTDGAWPLGPAVRVLREPRHGPPPRDELLAEAVRGRTDDEIEGRLAGWGGSGGVLRLVFTEMADRVDPRAACVVAFDVGLDYTLRVVPGSATAEPRVAADAEAVVRMTAADFLRMVVRELPAGRALSEGRMTIDGDASAAQRLFEMLPARGQRMPTDGGVFEMEVAVAVPPARVWRALTDELPEWFAEFADVLLDDGRYDFWGRYTMGAPSREDRHHAVLAYEHERSIRFAWPFRGADTTVELTLTGDGDTTWVRVLHEGLPARRPGVAPKNFWDFALANLRAWLELGYAMPMLDLSVDCHGGFEFAVDIEADVGQVFGDLYADQAGNREPGERWEMDVGVPIGLEVLVVDPDRRLDIGWTNGDRTSLVSWTLEGSGGRTRLTIVHSGMDPAHDATGEMQGWYASAAMQVKQRVEREKWDFATPLRARVLQHTLHPDADPNWIGHRRSAFDQVNSDAS